jgi:S1-C subfamily serine protease
VSIAPRSLAELAGLKYGDIIQTFNGHRVSDSDELNAYESETAPGSTLRLGFVRAGQSIVFVISQ